MSRVGKKPVSIPSGVDATIKDDKLIVIKGKLGELTVPFNSNVKVSIENGEISILPKAKKTELNNQQSSDWGLYRSLINNAVTGVTEGYKKTLEINGVGYKASIDGDILYLDLGFSHSIAYHIPEDVEVKCVKATELLISGKDKRLVGQVAAEIRSFRKPEPYKGKGIKYSDEHIVRKEGKKK